jgi:hypothetical protein
MWSTYFSKIYPNIRFIKLHPVEAKLFYMARQMLQNDKYNSHLHSVSQMFLKIIEEKC